MANEDEIIVLGAILALSGFLVMVSSPIDNLILGFVKSATLQGLQVTSIFWFFGGIALAVVAARSRKKTH